MNVCICVPVCVLSFEYMSLLAYKCERVLLKGVRRSLTVHEDHEFTFISSFHRM